MPVSLAAAIALGATGMSDIALLAQLAPVLGAAPSGPTVRRALDLAGTPAMLDKIARARAKARAHAWALIAGTSAGFPWLVTAGKELTGGGHRHCGEFCIIEVDTTPVPRQAARPSPAREEPKAARGRSLPPL